MLKKVMLKVWYCSLLIVVSYDTFLKSNQKIRWGIISTASINSAFIDGLRQSERSKLHAVASRELHKAQVYAQKYHIQRAYGSYEELLVDPKIDVVYNPLPNSLHAQWTLKAIKAGKHVLCEKPLVLTLKDLKTIKKEAKAHKVTVFEAFMYLHHPQTLKVKELIQSGAIGKLQLINSWFGFSFPINGTNYRLDPTMGGGCLWDIGVYCTSLAVALAQAGVPLEVHARATYDKNGADIFATGSMRFSNDVMALLSSSFSSASHAGAYIVGTEGIIKLDEPWKTAHQSGPSTIVLSNKAGTQKIVVPAKHSFLCEIEAMEACILDDAQPVVPLSLSKLFLKTMLALHESARTKQVVKLVHC